MFPEIEPLTSQDVITAQQKGAIFSLRAAIEMVRYSGMAKAKAAKLFGVPRATLIDKLAGHVPPSVLTAAAEKTLVRYADLMAQIGYSFTRKELLYKTKRILDIDGRKTVFRDNLPGKGWYKAFRMRNLELVERTSDALGHQRAAIILSMIQGLLSDDPTLSFLCTQL